MNKRYINGRTAHNNKGIPATLKMQGINAERNPVIYIKNPE